MLRCTKQCVNADPALIDSFFIVLHHWFFVKYHSVYIRKGKISALNYSLCKIAYCIYDLHSRRTKTGTIIHIVQEILPNVLLCGWLVRAVGHQQASITSAKI